MIKLITGIYAGVTSMIAAIFAIASRKAGTVAGGLAAFAWLTIIFIACINALVQSVIGMITTAQAAVWAWLLTPIGMFIPSNFALVMSAIISGKICRAAYDLGRKKTDIIVYGN